MPICSYIMCEVVVRICVFCVFIWLICLSSFVILIVVFIYFVAVDVKQDTFVELLNQGLVRTITLKESLPSKGKALNVEKPVWTVLVTLSNGNISSLLSARGTSREWSSLDTLDQWLHNHGVYEFNVMHMENNK